MGEAMYLRVALKLSFSTEDKSVKKGGVIVGDMVDGIGLTMECT